MAVEADAKTITDRTRWLCDAPTKSKPPQIELMPDAGWRAAKVKLRYELPSGILTIWWNPTLNELDARFDWMHYPEHPFVYQDLFEMAANAGRIPPPLDRMAPGPLDQLVQRMDLVLQFHREGLLAGEKSKSQWAYEDSRARYIRRGYQSPDPET